MGKWTEQTILKGSTNEAYEEILNILGYKGNANQNYIEIPSHPSQNGYHQ
jgi:hypothetical protein